MKKKMIFLILLMSHAAWAQLNIAVNTQQYYVVPDQLLGVNTPLYPDFLTPAPPCTKCEKSNTGNPCMNVGSISCLENGSCAGTWRTELPPQLETDADALHYRAMYYPEGVVSRYYHYVPGGKGFCINADEADYINLWGLNSGKTNPEPRKRYCNENSYNYTNFFEKNIQLCRNEAVPSKSMHMVISANVYFGTWHELKYTLEYCTANNVTVDAIVFGTEIEHDQDNVPSRILSDGDTIPFASGGSYFKHVQHVFIDSIKLDPLYAEIPLHFSTGIQHGGQGGCTNRTYFCDDTLGKKSLWNRQIHEAIEAYNQTHIRQLAFAGAVNWWWFPVNNDTLNPSATLAVNDMNEFFEQGVTATGHPLCYKYPGGVSSGEFNGFDQLLVVQWGVKKFNGTCNGTTYENRFITQVFILKRILNMLENNFNLEFNPTASNGIRYTNAFYHRLGSNNGYNPLDYDPDNGSWTTENISNYAIRQINSVSGHKFRRAEITNGPAKNLEAYYIFNCSEQKLFLINYSDTVLTINNLTVDSASFDAASLLNYQETAVAANSLHGILAPLSETNQNVVHEQVALSSIIVPANGILVIYLPLLATVGSQEVCNGIDDDCDAAIDEEQALYYADADSDGYGNPDAGVLLAVCSTPAGYVADNTDCMDDPVNGKPIHPGASEICNGADDNCNSLIDENVLSTFYEDGDGDLFGNKLITTAACFPPAGFVSDSLDCNDSSPAIHPGASEACNETDDNCNFSVDEGVQSLFYADEDGDTFGNEDTAIVACIAPAGYVSASGDCNDDPVTGAAIHPSANEVCNGMDDNCNAIADEGVQLTFYADEDGDSYGNLLMMLSGCSMPEGYAANGEDCDDSNGNGASIHPQATEYCNGIDDNCNGVMDENLQFTFYADEDGDSYGNPSVTALACSAPPGFTNNNNDCNDYPDGGEMIYPGATEICNSIDDNCNAAIDEGLQITFYADADGDTYGAASAPILACSLPSGYSVNNDDCDDSAVSGSLIYPGANEVCNGLDDNCNFVTDEGVLLLFYEDADGDFYGNSTITALACTLPPGYADNAVDCDDNLFSGMLIHPGAIEICNGMDDNCNAETDEGALVPFYADADGDGYGTPFIFVMACEALTGYVADSTDCNDSLSGINPAVSELCNIIDDNCNGSADEGVASLFYKDNDEDSFGDPANSLMGCWPPPGFVSDYADCDDDPFTGVNINPSAMEVCNNTDDDCNGLIDENVQSVFYLDADGDGFGNFESVLFACSVPAGYTANNTDCNDAAINGSLIHPGAMEVCNNTDDNCNGSIDEDVQSKYYHDADGDGYGTLSTIIFSCSPPAGYVADSSDCDDNPSTGFAIHASAIEICNTLDDNCDGVIDEGVQSVFYADADGDGYGNIFIPALSCLAPNGYVTDSTDCNDNALSGYMVHPFAVETCNGIDDNCNASTDEGVLLIFYEDADHDLYGNAATNVLSCTAPDEYVTDYSDCNDNMVGGSFIHPGATEICNMIDDNCDGTIDEGVQALFFADADGDTYGNSTVTLFACNAPSGYVSNPGDCNDDLIFGATIHPGAAEACNDLDDNCNSVVDEGVLTTFYADADGDSFGNIEVSVQACSVPAGFTGNSLDCDDNAASGATIYPGALEICNNLDDNCNAQTDEGVSIIFYRDADNDSYGAGSVTTAACSAPPGFVSNMLDCDDNLLTGAAIHPGMPDLCNLVDDNCNGITDENAINATVTPTGTVAVCIGASVTLTASSSTGISYQWIKGSSDLPGATNSTFSPGKMASYKVRETNNFNCSSTSAPATLIPASSAVAIITPLGNLDICQAGAVTLQAKPGPAYKYQWIKGSVGIAGATNASYTATTTAVYRVKVTGSNGCGTTSAGTKVTKSCKEEDGTISPKPDNFDFYPNPTDGRFIIVLSNEAYQHPDGSVPVLIEIRNALGELVYYDKTIKEESNFQREISLSKGLPPGIYFIRLVMPDKVFERKMVYQK